jgi:hypothetical protein
MVKVIFLLGMCMFFSGCVHLLPLAVFSSVRTEVKIRELEKKVETLKQQKVTKDDYKKEHLADTK